MFGDKESATVFVRDDGDEVGADGAGLVNNVLLVRTYQGAEHRHIQHAPHRRNVFEGLRAHLAQALPGHQGLGPAVQRNALGDAEHEPPVDHHPVGRRHG